MVDLGADEHALLEGGRARRDHKVLLERQLVARVRAAVDHVEARHGHDQLLVARQVGKVTVERHALGLSAALGGRERDAEDGVGAEDALVRRAVHVDHRLVNGCLVSHIHADELRGNFIVDIGDGGEDTLAHEAVAAVAQLDGLVGAGRRARGHRRTRHHTTCNQVNFDSRVAARVVDLACLDALDGAHRRHTTPGRDRAHNHGRLERARASEDHGRHFNRGARVRQ